MLDGSPFCKGKVLVKSLKELVSVRSTDSDGRHDHRNDHMLQKLSFVRTIDLCSLDQFTRDILDSRNVNDHHITDLLPAHQDHKAPESVNRRICKCFIDLKKQTV